LYDLETSRMRRPWTALGRSAPKKLFIYITCLLWGFTYHRMWLHLPSYV